MVELDEIKDHFDTKRTKEPNWN